MIRHEAWVEVTAGSAEEAERLILQAARDYFGDEAVRLESVDAAPEASTADGQIRLWKVSGCVVRALGLGPGRRG